MLHTLKKEASLKGVGLSLKGEGSCCMGARGWAGVGSPGPHFCQGLFPHWSPSQVF